MKIVSGGQTGVDRAALDAAIEMGLPYAGWCPEGGWAEDMPTPPGLRALYPELKETPLADPLQRTEWNVRDADRLLILVDRTGLGVSRGTAAARGFALRLGRPALVIDVDAPNAVIQARAFIEGANRVCIAGPRESEAPGLYAKALCFLKALFGHM